MAELTKRDFQVINFQRSLTTKECFDEMSAVFRDDCPSLRTIERWYLQFKRKSFSLDDDLRPGRPIELSTPENVAAVDKAIKGDRRITYRQLEEHLKIPVSTLPTPANANPLHSAAEVRGVLLVPSS